MAKFDTQAYIDLHSEALTEFDKVQSALRDERMQCLQDRRFYSIAGAQWEGPLGLQFENKPKLEINKIHLSVIRIINEYRNNKISVNFVPKDGTTGGSLGDTCQGLFRADEQDSAADEAYDNGFEEAVGGGFGAFRMRADYENEEDESDEKQKIFIEPIFDADSSVFFDVDAKRQDKRDAKKCWVLSSMSRAAYEKEYGEAPASMPKHIHQIQFDWLTPDVVYIAEYYVVEKVAQTLISYKGLSGEVRTFDEDDLDAEKKAELKQTGFTKSKTRKIKKQKVHKYLISGTGILEDCGLIAGKNIPIIPIYGKRWFIDNVERCMGHVRLAKDPQRIKNMQMSKLAEIAGLSSIEKPIFTPEQMAGHAVQWSEDNTQNYPYLLLNSIKDDSGQPIQNGPVAYTKVPSIPPAMAALLQTVEQDIQDILGNQEAGEELQANLSGVAVELVQQRLDMQTYIYISNFAKAMKRAGEIWLDMAKEIYVEQDRKRKTIGEDGKVGSVTLMQQNVDADTGVPKLTNDLSEADFDVTALPGPTSASKRSSINKILMALLPIIQDPTTLQIIMSMIIMNLEGEGLGEIRDYFRKQLVTMGVVKPTPEEQQQLKQDQAAAAQQPPSANDQFLIASANQANADAMKSQADTVKSAAQAELAKAQAMQILSDIKAGKIEQAFSAIEALQNAALGQQTAQQGQQDAQQNAAQSAAELAHTHAKIAQTNAQTNAINNPPPAQ
jgi:hypothetical protein